MLSFHWLWLQAPDDLVGLHSGPRFVADVLRFSGGALAASSHDQSDRVDVRHHPPPNDTNPRLRDTGQPATHDAQTRQMRRTELAKAIRFFLSEFTANESAIG